MHPYVLFTSLLGGNVELSRRNCTLWLLLDQEKTNKHAHVWFKCNWPSSVMIKQREKILPVFYPAFKFPESGRLVAIPVGFCASFDLSRRLVRFLCCKPSDGRLQFSIRGKLEAVLPSVRVLLDDVYPSSSRTISDKGHGRLRAQRPGNLNLPKNS